MGNMARRSIGAGILLVSLCSAMLVGGLLPHDKRDEVIEEAKRYIGVPYLSGGTTPSGFDCSGYIWYIFRQIGGDVPRITFDQYAKLAVRQEPRPGDLVYFHTAGPGASHVGIYIGDGKFLHSPQTGYTIDYANLNDAYWRANFEGIRSAFVHPDDRDFDTRLISARTRVLGRFAFSDAGLFASGSSPNGLDAIFAVHYGLAVEIPLAPSWTLSPRLLLDFAVVNDAAHTWLPASVRVPLMGRYYLVDGASFGLALEAGPVVGFSLGEYTGTDGYKNFTGTTFDLAIGTSFEFGSWGIDLSYELGLTDTYSSDTASGRLGRFTIGIQFAL
ncbi:MAG TPA: NlpC/P60 family protein [Spirochaetota bacterium]|nr:NlpC/P60 family protein [Spirochaetota bacterium]